MITFLGLFLVFLLLGVPISLALGVDPARADSASALMAAGVGGAMLAAPGLPEGPSLYAIVDSADRLNACAEHGAHIGGLYHDFHRVETLFIVAAAR